MPDSVHTYRKFFSRRDFSFKPRNDTEVFFIFLQQKSRNNNRLNYSKWGSSSETVITFLTTYTYLTS